MATLKSIRKRIASVRNTQKITRAMKMVAAAKLRRAQLAVQSSRPYSKRLKDLVLSVVERDETASHALFEGVKNPRRVSVLLYTSNRGLCGGFNSNLLRHVETHLKNAKYEIADLSIIGKKGRDFYLARKRDIKDLFLDYAQEFPFEAAVEMAQKMINGYLAGEYDVYFIAYNQFKSALSQNVQIEKLIPFTIPESFEKEKTKESEGKFEPHSIVDFIYEPSKAGVLDQIIPKYVASQLYLAHLESVASELGARMTAMESATSNANDMISGLTLQYNRLRQAAITKELLDIVNGAEAIK